ncbi:MBL fold metallo-hydrolase [Trebonia kvetii]|uniref:MBL fold metallo-hydrolase n=1 Tax=Trebonia kvetii TaxID=2480626 RepID=A0A6P2BQ48_9ACTN|nr:MBL fold metallo-hydrolase [Trebonia kvetii]TVZ00978.1 MBL fold metallo-hydrolase [Trebonia kvetii]
MLVTGFPAGAFAANCYLVAPAPGEECVIIDPGQNAERGIEELLDRYRLKPSAVLLTHGHVDHMWSVAPVCGAKGVPAYIHPDDRELLADPGKGLSLLAKQQFMGGMTFAEPDDVRQLHDGDVITVAGLDITIGHTPGHTPGSVTFRSGEDDLDALFTGDLLFAGSIGRTDLPGGDHATILKSLARTLTLPDETIVLPGHGPQTTIGDERGSNPFLTGLQPAQKGL